MLIEILCLHLLNKFINNYWENFVQDVSKNKKYQTILRATSQKERTLLGASIRMGLFPLVV